MLKEGGGGNNFLKKLKHCRKLVLYSYDSMHSHFVENKKQGGSQHQGELQVAKQGGSQQQGKL